MTDDIIQFCFFQAGIKNEKNSVSATFRLFCFGNGYTQEQDKNGSSY